MDKSFNLKVQTDEASLSKTNGKFTIEPLSRGYGITLGNAMRRVLLRSIPGAAITHLKIEGVEHEFSSIKGVKDDVADIIMNLKLIRFRLMDNNPDKINLSFRGKSIVKAKDLQDASDQFEILNPEQYITEVNSSGKLDMEIRIGIGMGYVPSEENELPNLPLGTLSIDSIFNPVTKVSYDVKPVPGAKDPIEILTMNVQTDGSINPKDALTEAAKILIHHFMLFSDERISIQTESDSLEDDYDEESLHMRQLLKTRLIDMDLSVRALNCLKAAEVDTLGDLVSYNRNDLMKFRNFGKKSLTELDALVEDKNLSFGMDLSKYKLEKE